MGGDGRGSIGYAVSCEGEQGAAAVCHPCCAVSRRVCLQVLDVDYAAGRATIKLVPRLDLAAMAKDHRSGVAPG